MAASSAAERPGLWRQIRAIGALPGVVAVVVPAVLVALNGTDVGWGLPGAAVALPVLAGVALIAAGAALWWWTVSLFSEKGKGTLAPWDPTQELVVLGPYRHVRNPMITAVATVLLGEAALLGSTPILAWFGIFALVNATFIPLFEEPGLVRRFGDRYRAYRREVPRWIPRREPWPP